MSIHSSIASVQKDEPIWSVGLMTGTVLDGNIDVAMIRTDGEKVFEAGVFVLAPYDPDIVKSLEQSLARARDWQFQGPEPELFKSVEKSLTYAQSAAVQELVTSSGRSMTDIGVVGFHGQTVLHRPPQSGQAGKTRQLGDGQLMADILEIPVAYDFRTADIAAGGQGAPLAAAYHVALLRSLDDCQSLAGSTAVLNLGGVANITWWDGQDQVVAFDTGPANAPINDFVKSLNLGDMDADGQLAAKGTVDEAKLQAMLDHPYFAAPYPKSLDRFDFSWALADGSSAQDGAALLTAFSAAAIGRALDLLPARPARLIVCGGGRRNLTLMQEINQRASVVAVAAESVGWRGDATEAECFAFLAVRVMRGLPYSFPSTTGVPRPQCGGQLVLPRNVQADPA